MEQEIAGESDDVNDAKMMGVVKPFKVHPKRIACYKKVKNILDFDDDRGADMLEMSEAIDEEDENERESSIPRS